MGDAHEDAALPTINSRVAIFLDKSEAFGIVRYVGETSFANGNWVGLELDEPLGKNNGFVDGVWYFQCAPLHGLFAKPQMIRWILGSSSHRTNSRNAEGVETNGTVAITLRQRVMDKCSSIADLSSFRRRKGADHAFSMATRALEQTEEEVEYLCKVLDNAESQDAVSVMEAQVRLLETEFGSLASSESEARRKLLAAHTANERTHRARLALLAELRSARESAEEEEQRSNDLRDELEVAWANEAAMNQSFRIAQADIGVLKAQEIFEIKAQQRAQLLDQTPQRQIPSCDMRKKLELVSEELHSETESSRSKEVLLQASAAAFRSELSAVESAKVACVDAEEARDSAAEEYNELRSESILLKESCARLAEGRADSFGAQQSLRQVMMEKWRIVQKPDLDIQRAQSFLSIASSVPEAAGEDHYLPSPNNAISENRQPLDAAAALADSEAKRHDAEKKYSTEAAEVRNLRNAVIMWKVLNKQCAETCEVSVAECKAEFASELRTSSKLRNSSRMSTTQSVMSNQIAQIKNAQDVVPAFTYAENIYEKAETEIGHLRGELISEQRACHSREDNIESITNALQEVIDEFNEETNAVLSLEYGSAIAASAEAERQLSITNRRFAWEEAHLEEISRLKISLAASEGECRQQALINNRFKEIENESRRLIGQELAERGRQINHKSELAGELQITRVEIEALQQSLAEGAMRAKASQQYSSSDSQAQVARDQGETAKKVFAAPQGTPSGVTRAVTDGRDMFSITKKALINIVMAKTEALCRAKARVEELEKELGYMAHHEPTTDEMANQAEDVVVLLRHEDVETRLEGCQRSHRLGHAMTQHMHALTGCLNDEDPDVREAAAGSLAKLYDQGVAMPSTVYKTMGKLAWDLQSRDLDTRHMAILLLGELGSLASTQSGALAACVHDENDEVREAALAALEKINWHLSQNIEHGSSIHILKMGHSTSSYGHARSVHQYDQGNLEQQKQLQERQLWASELAAVQAELHSSESQLRVEELSARFAQDTYYAQQKNFTDELWNVKSEVQILTDELRARDQNRQSSLWTEELSASSFVGASQTQLSKPNEASLRLEVLAAMESSNILEDCLKNCQILLREVELDAGASENKLHKEMLVIEETNRRLQNDLDISKKHLWEFLQAHAKYDLLCKRSREAALDDSKRHLTKTQADEIEELWRSLQDTLEKTKQKFWETTQHTSTSDEILRKQLAAAIELNRILEIALLECRRQLEERRQANVGEQSPRIELLTTMSSTRSIRIDTDSSEILHPGLEQRETRDESLSKELLAAVESSRTLGSRLNNFKVLLREVEHEAGAAAKSFRSELCSTEESNRGLQNVLENSKKQLQKLKKETGAANEILCNEISAVVELSKSLQNELSTSARQLQEIEADVGALVLHGIDHNQNYADLLKKYRAIEGNRTQLRLHVAGSTDNITKAFVPLVFREWKAGADIAKLETSQQEFVQDGLDRAHSNHKSILKKNDKLELDIRAAEASAEHSLKETERLQQELHNAETEVDTAVDFYKEVMSATAQISNNSDEHRSELIMAAAEVETLTDRLKAELWANKQMSAVCERRRSKIARAEIEIETLTNLLKVGRTQAQTEKAFSQMKLKIDGIDYDKLMAIPAKTAEIIDIIKAVVMQEVGNDVKESSIDVQLSKGSVLATIKIFEPTTNQLESSTSLTNSIATIISERPGIKDVQNGPIVVGSLDNSQFPDSLSPAETATHKSQGAVKINVRPTVGNQNKLILHFDVNGTILATDPASGQDVVGVINTFLAGACWGKETDGIWKWSKETENGVMRMTCPTDAETSYYKYLESRVPDRKSFKASVGAFSKDFKQFSDVADRMLTALRAPESLRGTPFAFEQAGELFHSILPSVWRLLASLLEQGRDLAIVIRTFGSNGPEIASALNAFIKGKHPSYPAVCDRWHVADASKGCITFNDEGVMHLDLESQSIEGEEAICAYFQRIEGIFVVKDDYTWWKKHNFSEEGGKPVWIVAGDQPQDSHTMFFDDNFRPDAPENSILNVKIAASSGSGYVLRGRMESALAETIGCAHTANLKCAVEDEEYFVEIVRQLEEKWSQRQFPAVEDRESVRDKARISLIRANRDSGLDGRLAQTCVDADVAKQEARAATKALLGFLYENKKEEKADKACAEGEVAKQEALAATQSAAWSAADTKPLPDDAKRGSSEDEFGDDFVDSMDSVGDAGWGGLRAAQKKREEEEKRKAGALEEKASATNVEAAPQEKKLSSVSSIPSPQAQSESGGIGAGSRKSLNDNAAQSYLSRGITLDTDAFGRCDTTF